MTRREIILDADDLVGPIEDSFDYEAIAAQSRMRRFKQEYFPIATAAELEREAINNFYEGLRRI